MEFKTEYFTELAETGVANIRYPETTPGLYEPIRYAMSAGGKRIRPALTLAVFAALSGRDPKDPCPAPFSTSALPSVRL